MGISLNLTGFNGGDMGYMCIINIFIWVGLKRGSSPKHIFLWGK